MPGRRRSTAPSRRVRGGAAGAKGRKASGQTVPGRKDMCRTRDGPQPAHGTQALRMVRSMITLTRFSGSVFALNSDLIERVDSTPDTVITLVDGTKYVVTEGLQEVVDAIREYR